MEGLRSRFQNEGVSKDASKLTIKSRRSSSNSNYESEVNEAWSKWTGWCAKRKIDPFCSNINQILESLSQLFQNGTQYRTIIIVPRYLLLITTVKGSQWGNTPEFVLWLLVFLVVDLHNQGTVLFGMSSQ